MSVQLRADIFFRKNCQFLGCGTFSEKGRADKFEFLTFKINFKLWH